MCRFRVNRRPIGHIFHRFQNVPASCERSLRFQMYEIMKLKVTDRSNANKQTCKDFSFASLLTSPDKQQYERALTIICLFDLPVGFT